MKLFNKTHKKKINTILLVLFLSFFGIIFFGNISLAKDIEYDVQVPGFTGSKVTFGGTTAPIGNYIKGIYNYGIGIVAILATVVMMIGGFQWIISGGSAEKVGEAKAWITASLSGLILALSSYMILSLISPNLVNFAVSNVKVIIPVAERPFICCDQSGAGSSVHKTCLIKDPTVCTEVCLDSNAQDCDFFCIGKIVGTPCHGDGYCYDGGCFTGLGQYGEPCGMYTNTICSTTCYGNILHAINPLSYLSGYNAFQAAAAGRDCDKDLYCCPK